MSDGTSEEPMVVPVLNVAGTVGMNRRGFLGVGLGATAALALMGAGAARGAAVTSPPSTARAHVGGVRQTIMLPDRRTVATIGEDRMIKLWSLADGKLVAVLAGPPGDRAEIVVSADRTAIASIHAPSTVFIWTLSPVPKLLTRLNYSHPKASERGYVPSIRHLAVGPAGAFVVVSHDSELVALGTNGKVIGQATVAGGVTDLLPGADGKSVIVALGDGTVRRYDVPSMKPNGEFRNPRGTPRILGVLPDGASVITSASDGNGRGLLLVRAIADGKTLASLDASAYEPLVSNAASIDAAAYVDSNGRIKTIEPGTGRALATCGTAQDRPQSISMSDDGARVCGVVSEQVRVWNARDGSEIGAFAPPASDVGRSSSATLSVDGQTLVTIGRGGDASLWTVSPPGFRTYLRDPSISPVPPPATIGRAHESAVNSVIAVGPTMLATASSDNSIKLWNGANGQLIAVLCGHTADVTRLVATPDGKMMVSTSADRTLRVWSIAERKTTAVIGGYPIDGAPPVISADGKLLVAATMGAELRLWSLPDGQLRQTLSCGEDAGRCNSLSLSGDATVLAAGLQRGGACVWSLPSGKLLARCVDDSIVHQIALTPDGSSVVMDADTTGLSVWPLSDPRPLRDPIARSSRGPGGNNHSRLVILRDGRTIVCGKGQDVSFHGVVDGGLLARFGAHKSAVRAVAASPDGRLAIVGSDDGTATLWFCQDRRCLLTIATAPIETTPGRPREAAGVGDVAFISGSGSGGLAIADKSGGVGIWDLTSPIKFRFGLVDPAVQVKKPPVVALRGHQSGVIGLQFSRDGRTLYSGGREGLAKAWELATRSVTATMTAGTSMELFTVATDESRLATSGGDGTIRTFALPKGTPADVARPAGPSRPVSLFAPRGDTVLSVGIDGKLSVFRFPKSEPEAVVSLSKLPDGGHRSVQKEWCAISPDGRSVTTSAGGSYRLVSVPDGAVIVERQAGYREMATVCLSRDGKILATAGTDGVMLWSMPQFTLTGTLDGVVGNVSGLVFSPDARYLAATDGASVRIWSVTDGKLLAVLEGDARDAGVRGRTMEFSFDSALLAVASGAFVELWSATNGRLLAKLAGHNGTVGPIVFSPDSTQLASGDDSGTIIIWDIAKRAMLSCLFDAAATPPDVKANNYSVADASGKVVYFTQPCGTPMPPGATCVCNCVPGSYASRPTGGGYVPSGGGSYCTCNSVCTCVPVFISDRAAKENFEPVDPQEVLRQLASLPIGRWNYRGEEPSTRHLGPMAQDFAATLGLGSSDRLIHAADASGVALVAIQALLQRLQEQEAAMVTLRREVAHLRAEATSVDRVPR